MQPRGVGNQLPAPATPVSAQKPVCRPAESTGRHVVAAALLARLAPPALRDAARITGQDRVQDDSGSFGTSAVRPGSRRRSRALVRTASTSSATGMATIGRRAGPGQIRRSRTAEGRPGPARPGQIRRGSVHQPEGCHVARDHARQSTAGPVEVTARAARYRVGDRWYSRARIIAPARRNAVDECLQRTLGVLAPPVDVPMPALGVPEQVRIGIHGLRVADQLQPGSVGVAVAVGVGAGQVDAVIVGIARQPGRPCLVDQGGVAR